MKPCPYLHCDVKSPTIEDVIAHVKSAHPAIYKGIPLWIRNLAEEWRGK